jgi:hypothetical protein
MSMFQHLLVTWGHKSSQKCSKFTPRFFSPYSKCKAGLSLFKNKIWNVWLYFEVDVYKWWQIINKVVNNLPNYNLFLKNWVKNLFILYVASKEPKRRLWIRYWIFKF